MTVSLERYADLPSRGLVLGRLAHPSHARRGRRPACVGMVAAEDVYVGNLLEMGNISGTHFKQPKQWGPASRYAVDKRHFVVSGQEDPRTGHMGHTIHHNLESPSISTTDDYFFYNKVFEQSHKQGGSSGFAHMGSGFNGQRGLALTVPFGLVDFIEVLQAGRLFTDVWYRFLDLGYRISPAAGSDWPYSDFPGVVRNYVKLNGRLDLDAWFESFHAGHVYVSNGPLLEFTVNGKQMGEELRVKRGAKLTIAASAQLNPDVDALDRLELVVLSDVAATVAGRGQGPHRRSPGAEGRTQHVDRRARARGAPGAAQHDRRAQRADLCRRRRRAVVESERGAGPRRLPARAAPGADDRAARAVGRPRAVGNARPAAERMGQAAADDPAERGRGERALRQAAGSLGKFSPKTTQQ